MIIRTSTVLQTRWPSGLGVGMLTQSDICSWVRFPSMSHFLLTKQIFSSGYLSSFLLKVFINFQINNQDRKKSTVVNLGSKVCICGLIRTRKDWNQKPWGNYNSYFHAFRDKVAEWLRRWTANPIRFRVPSLSYFALTKQIFSSGYLSSFLSKISSSVSKQTIKIGKKSTVDNLWSKECIYGSIRIRIDWNQKPKRNDNSYFKGFTDKVAEWLRRWTANPIRSPCVVSNPISFVFCFNKENFFQWLLIKFSVKDFFISFQTNYQDRKKINSRQSVIKRVHLRVD